jgi:hypothetical protein
MYLEVNPDQAKSISVDPSGFDNNLGPTDDTVQKIADVLDSAGFSPFARTIIVKRGDTDVESGNNLLAAYGQAYNSIPQPSVDNQIVIFVPTGVYDIGSSYITRYWNYIHLIGEGVCRNLGDDHTGPFTYPSTVITGSSGFCIIKEQGQYGLLKGFRLHTRSNGANHIWMNSGTAGSGLCFIDIGLTEDYPEGSGHGIYASTAQPSINSYFKNVHTPSTIIGYVSRGGACGGTFINCTAQNDSFGAGGFAEGFTLHVTGTFENCYADTRSFGYQGGQGDLVFSGKAIDCKANDWSFCVGGPASTIDITFSGLFERCKLNSVGFCYGGGNYANFASFEGRAVDCDGGSYSFAGGLEGTIQAGAELLRCKCRNDSFGRRGFHGYAKDCVIDGDDSMPTGTGPTASTGVMEDCRMLNRTQVIADWNGTMRHCVIESTVDGVSIAGNGTVFDDCAFEVGAAAESIAAGAAYNARVMNCQMNRDINTSITNRIGNGYNVVDANFKV